MAIAKNAGLEGAVIVDKIKGCAVGEGYNALTDEYGDMIAMGIVDPVKVTRSACRMLHQLLQWYLQQKASWL